MSRSATIKHSLNSSIEPTYPIRFAVNSSQSRRTIIFVGTVSTVRLHMRFHRIHWKRSRMLHYSSRTSCNAMYHKRSYIGKTASMRMCVFVYKGYMKREKAAVDIHLNRLCRDRVIHCVNAMTTTYHYRPIPPILNLVDRYPLP